MQSPQNGSTTSLCSTLLRPSVHEEPCIRDMWVFFTASCRLSSVCANTPVSLCVHTDAVTGCRVCCGRAGSGHFDQRVLPIVAEPAANVCAGVSHQHQPARSAGDVVSRLCLHTFQQVCCVWQRCGKPSTELRVNG